MGVSLGHVPQHAGCRGGCAFVCVAMGGVESRCGTSAQPLLACLDPLVFDRQLGGHCRLPLGLVLFSQASTRPARRLIPQNTPPSSPPPPPLFQSHCRCYYFPNAEPRHCAVQRGGRGRHHRAHGLEACARRRVPPAHAARMVRTRAELRRGVLSLTLVLLSARPGLRHLWAQASSCSACSA